VEALQRVHRVEQTQRVLRRLHELRERHYQRVVYLMRGVEGERDELLVEHDQERVERLAGTSPPPPRLARSRARITRPGA
jgi:hypothetical protein